jgi:hypothetical protein
LAIIGVIAAIDQASAAGPPAGLDVNVTNTPANPVPVTGSITGSVTGTVGLSPNASVFVNNPATDPVRVRSVNDGIQPVQAHASCTTNALGCLPNIYTVPAGKRLVIEYVSAEACLLPGVAALFSISTSVGGQYVTHYLPGTPPANSPGSVQFGCNASPSSFVTAGAQVRIYADAGTTIQGEAARNPVTGVINADLAISGYLIDVPLTP